MHVIHGFGRFAVHSKPIFPIVFDHVNVVLQRIGKWRGCLSDELSYSILKLEQIQFLHEVHSFVWKKVLQSTPLLYNIFVYSLNMLLLASFARLWILTVSNLCVHCILRIHFIYSLRWKTGQICAGFFAFLSIWRGSLRWYQLIGLLIGFLLSLALLISLLLILIIVYVLFLLRIYSQIFLIHFYKYYKIEYYQSFTFIILTFY